MRIGKIIRIGLAGLLLSGCATTEKAKKGVEQPTLTPRQTIENYDQRMQDVEKTREGSLNAADKEFMGLVRGYEQETKKRATERAEEIRKYLERLEKYGGSNPPK